MGEEDAIAMSQGLQIGKFDIEASHSFSLRNYGKDKVSAALIETSKDHLPEGGRESSASNYSKIQAESN